MKFSEKSGVVFNWVSPYVKNAPKLGHFYKILFVDFQNEAAYIDHPGPNENGLWGVQFDADHVTFIESQFEASKEGSSILENKFVERVNRPFEELGILGPRLCGMSTLLRRYKDFCKNQGMDVLLLDNDTSFAERTSSINGKHFNLVILDNFTKKPEDVLARITYDRIILAQSGLYPSFTMSKFDKMECDNQIFVKGDSSFRSKETLEELKKCCSEYQLFTEHFIS